MDTPFDPRLNLADYKFPTLDLLEDYAEDYNETKQEVKGTERRLADVLLRYGVEISKIKGYCGPVVSMFEIWLAPGVRVSAFKRIEKELELEFSKGVRLIAPLPGRGTVGVEIPNRTRRVVSARDVLTSDSFLRGEKRMPIALGCNTFNEPIVADLTDLSKILLVGATGQGKSVCISSIITSILYCKHPAEVKFVLIDTKGVELTLFNRIERHYLAKLPDTYNAVITDGNTAYRTLYSLCIELDNRYELMRDACVRNIREYNRKFTERRLNPVETVKDDLHHQYLPDIVIAIDDYADLLSNCEDDIESVIERLANMGHAVGIHLIVALQKASSEVISSDVKALFPARIAFRVMSGMDSQLVLDAYGAENLTNRGDMLFFFYGDIVRLQGTFVGTSEIERICDFIGFQRGYPDAYLLPECPSFSEDDEVNEYDLYQEWDSILREAAELVVSTQQSSTSMLQRKFKLGYNRAGQIMDQLEAVGVVSAFDGHALREVKVKDSMALEDILDRLGI